jgi:hypothetical protein
MIGTPPRSRYTVLYRNETGRYLLAAVAEAPGARWDTAYNGRNLLVA